MPVPPSKCQILVIGGGPAGSYTASALTREGFDVVLLEADRFPRYHIGESMLPSLRAFLRFIDCEQKVVDYGFTIKPGAAVKLNQHKREGYTDFIGQDHYAGASFNVVRSEFDKLLLDHASECGAKVFQETKVTSLDFQAPTPPSSPPNTASSPPGPASSNPRPIAAHYKQASGTTGTISFTYLIDASGRNGIMSTKYLHNRHMNSSLKNIACWGYWKNCGRYMPGTKRENAPFFQALTDESGWGWFIPLHNGTVSVGVVMDQAISIQKKSAASAAGSQHTLTDHYLSQFALLPTFDEFLKNAFLVIPEDGKPAVKSATDFSYSASSYAGPYFRLVGDASAFIDPFFSSGIHLALSGGLSAAASISASIRKDVTEEQAYKYHDSKVAISYTRFLLVVAASYKQIRNQSAPLLSDVNEDNFDRAFNLIRPVIQGTADAGKRLTESELQKTLDFCQHVVAPTDTSMFTSVASRVDASLLQPDAPVMSASDIEKVVGEGDEEAKMVLGELNARKPIYMMTGKMELEEVEGLKVRVERGSLGLIPV